MENSRIEWCDHTFNPWEGCTKVSPGCEHCYAEARNARYAGGKAPNWGKGAPRRRTSASNWAQPLKWNSVQEVLLNDHIINQRPRVFCASLADWLDDEVSIYWLVALLDLVRMTPNLDWLLLTKRPENFRRRLNDAFKAVCHEVSSPMFNMTAEWLNGIPPDNVWIGTTVEDQSRADKRIPALEQIPARMRFLSCEPLLGPVLLNLSDEIPKYVYPQYSFDRTGIHWVICGGESGHDARPMHPDWAISLRDQCKLAAVPFLFKQWGEWSPGRHSADTKQFAEWWNHKHGWFYTPTPNGRNQEMSKVGKKAAGRVLEGAEHNQFPEVRA